MIDLGDFAAGFVLCLALSVWIAAWASRKVSALYRGSGDLIEILNDEVEELNEEIKQLESELAEYRRFKGRKAK